MLRPAPSKGPGIRHFRPGISGNDHLRFQDRGLVPLWRPLFQVAAGSANRRSGRPRVFAARGSGRQSFLGRLPRSRTHADGGQGLADVCTQTARRISASSKPGVLPTRSNETRALACAREHPGCEATDRPPVWVAPRLWHARHGSSAMVADAGATGAGNSVSPHSLSITGQVGPLRPDGRIESWLRVDLYPWPRHPFWRSMRPEFRGRAATAKDQG